MIGPSYPFKGGIAQYTTQLYRALAERHQLMFCSFSRQYPKWLYPGGSDIDLSNTSLREEAAQPLLDSMNPMSWRKTAQEIAVFGADVLILHWWVVFWAPQYAAIIFMLRRRCPKTRLVFICHNVISHESNWWVSAITKKVLSLGDAYLVQSEAEREAMQAWCEPQAKITVAEHPAYDTSAYPRMGRGEARKLLDISGPVLLFFGFVRPYKGLDVLLRAMPEVLEACSCTLVVAGEIWGERQHYQQLAQSLGIEQHVRFVDHYIAQTDVPTYFYASDIVILPYRSATGSGVVKLAYSFGRPVIVAEVGSLPDVVSQGLTGYTVPAVNPAALSRVIVGHLNGADQAAMDNASLAKGQQYTWTALLDGLESLFPQVAD